MVKNPQRIPCLLTLQKRLVRLVGFLCEKVLFDGVVVCFVC